MGVDALTMVARHAICDKSFPFKIYRLLRMTHAHCEGSIDVNLGAVTCQNRLDGFPPESGLIHNFVMLDPWYEYVH